MKKKSTNFIISDLSSMNSSFFVCVFTSFLNGHFLKNQNKNKKQLFFVHILNKKQQKIRKDLPFRSHSSNHQFIILYFFLLEKKNLENSVNCIPKNRTNKNNTHMYAHSHTHIRMNDNFGFLALVCVLFFL